MKDKLYKINYIGTDISYIGIYVDSKKGKSITNCEVTSSFPAAIGLFINGKIYPFSKASFEISSDNLSKFCVPTKCTFPGRYWSEARLEKEINCSSLYLIEEL